MILITGGAGFIGSNLALKFKELDSNKVPEYGNLKEVYCMDNLHRSGSELNVTRLRDNKINLIRGDIRNKEDFPVESPDVIIECSAEPSVMAGINSSPEYLIHTNLLGTINCLEYARKHDSDFIFLSTSRVYPIKYLRKLKLTDDTIRFDLDYPYIEGIPESFPLDAPRTLYGTTKLASELLIQEYNDVYGLKTIINRCGLIAGQGQFGKTDQGVITLWLAKHFYNQPLTIYGYHGRQVRDVLNVKDLFDLVLEELKRKTLSGQTFNVGGGYQNSISLNQLTTLCQEITGNHPKISYVDEIRQGDIPIYISDNKKVMEATDWSPKIDIRTTVTEIIKWIQDNSELLKPILS